MLVFLKLGGSLITDKSAVEVARTDQITRLASEIATALQRQSDLSLVIGHGSGSFGHTAAKQFGTRSGVRGIAAWKGFATVSLVAGRLNQLVLEGLYKAGVPVLRIQPSASAICNQGKLVQMAIKPIEGALKAGLVPLVYGDAAMDVAWGGTIISTEEIFAYLTHVLSPVRILITGGYEGVLDQKGQVISHITPHTLPNIRGVLGNSATIDVTGGMASKVANMMSLCQAFPGLSVHIFSGQQAGNVLRALTEENIAFGTHLSA